MGLTSFEIIFDNPTKYYSPGDHVTGRVFLDLENEKKVQGMKLKYEGKASVYWTESENRVSGHGDNLKVKKVSRTYQDSDEFFQHKCYLVGDGQNDVILPAGRSEYRFQFVLPIGLPSSFVGAYGMVIYEVEATLKRSWKFDHKVTQKFIVNATVDLNMDPLASQPAELRRNKTLCCFWCKSGPISIVVRIPKKGYVAGEFIAAVAEITNLSTTNISSSKICILQKSKFYAQGRTRESVKAVCEVTRPGIQPGGSDTWQGDLIQVPSVPPSRLGQCRIIDVQYELNIELKVSSLSSNVKVTTPIVIGTIPVRTGIFPEMMPKNPPSFVDNQFAPSAPLIYPYSPPPYYPATSGFGNTVPQPNSFTFNQGYPQKPEFVPNYGWNFPPLNQ